MAMDPSWYLRKYEGGGIFGPLPFDQLSRWASKAPNRSAGSCFIRSGKLDESANGLGAGNGLAGGGNERALLRADNARVRLTNLSGSAK